MVFAGSWCLFMLMSRNGFLILFVLAVAAPAGLQASEAVKLPAVLERFVEPGTTPIALEKADLNGDGLDDYILVLEPPATDNLPEHDPRPLLILTSLPDKTLKLAARNDRSIYCRECGGAFGDPFWGVKAETKAFTVQNYGGAGWRWQHDFKFAYSRRDDAWQLVEVKQESYHSGKPEDVQRTMAKPPDDFGKIDFRHFDASRWQGEGEGSLVAAKHGLCIGWDSGDAVHMESCAAMPESECTQGRKPLAEYDLVQEVAQGPLFIDSDGGLFEFRLSEKPCKVLAIESAREAEKTMSGQWARWVYAEDIKVGDRAAIYGKNVKVHSEPGVGADVLRIITRASGKFMVMQKSEATQVNEMSSSWFKLSLGRGTGWVWGEYVHPDPQSEEKYIH